MKWIRYFKILQLKLSILYTSRKEKKPICNLFCYMILRLEIGFVLYFLLYRIALLGWIVRNSIFWPLTRVLWEPIAWSLRYG